jgi:methylase of polypeptide subunit release factors
MLCDRENADHSPVGRAKRDQQRYRFRHRQLALNVRSFLLQLVPQAEHLGPLASRTQSLTSSVSDFKYIHGRRYHSYKEGEYLLPNDEAEQERLDMQHAIFRYALDGKLFLAPIEKGRLHDVLDVGTGTGSWAIDVADENPQAQVLGFDLSPIQPAM